MSDPISRLNAMLEGRYRVERELGRGGMATVYLAQDPRHGRQVALKVLSPELAAVVGAERFLAEIKTTANLQHPHILPLHDSGAADGLLYYVMPYVEGESLRQRLDRERQLPVEDGVDIATHVADALDYAHRKGVVHRDIKPANVLMTEGGAIVSDFGIALALGAAGGDRLTETGLSLGTPHYMSPEQATGDQHVGPATDIYALGCVLYEMLVGEPPYTGSTAQAVLGKIVMGAPEPVTKHRASVPPNVEATISRALQRVPADRFRTARDMAQALSDPGFRHRGDRAAALTGPSGQRRMMPAVGALVLALFGFWAGRTLRSDPTGVRWTEPVRLAVSIPPDQQPSVRFWEPPVAISADGTLLAYTAMSGGTSHLYLRPLGEFAARALPGTEGAQVPFFSPDGRSLGFLRNGRLWRVALDGGAPLPICDAGSGRFGATWGRDGYIYFGDEQGLRRVSADGGTPQVVSPLHANDGEIARYLPQALPDGRMLFSVAASTGGRAEILDPATGESRTVVEGAAGARYAPGGWLVYAATGVTQVVRFDLERAEVTSAPASLTDDVYVQFGNVPLIALTDDGALVYVPAGTSMRGSAGGLSGDSSALVRVGRDGRATPLWERWPGQGGIGLSPDGRTVVDYVRLDDMERWTGSFRIWAFDLDRHTSIALTSDGTAVYPAWTPDGAHVAFSSTLAGPMSIYWVSSAGSTEPQSLFVDDEEQYVNSFSPDGRNLLFQQRSDATGSDIWLLPLSGDREPRPLVRTTANEGSATVSPDGQWLAYVSDASGRGEVYIQPFPEGGDRTPVSNAGGGSARWSPDGRELFYRRGDGFWSVPIRTGPTLEVGTPELLFEGSYGGYAVDPGGDGFVMVRHNASTQPAQFKVVQNWTRELERLVPATR